jgi:hypothetical protein
VTAAGYRALVCVTTCRRFHVLPRYLPHFAAFTESDPRFSLLVALDGTAPEYLEFAERWRVPMVYSDEREGVGISKNRVLERFGDFDYYFFLDDDVELMDGRVFPDHISVARAGGIHHFSLFQRGGVRKPTGESTVEGRRILHGMFGGGQFNFFTREGLEKVGGWHPRFAEFRRWGHTEHSYRFYNAGLAPAPFNVIDDLSESCIWHYPPPVTSAVRVDTDDDQLPAPERELLDQRLEHVPIETISAHHFNGIDFGALAELASTLSSADRYPLLGGRERRRCVSDLRLWQGRTARTRSARWAALARAALAWPGNPRLRHQLKTGR